MKNLTIHYVPNDEVQCVPDGKAKDYVYNLIKSLNKQIPTVLLTCQELIVYYVRLAILDGLISYDDVVFEFDDYKLYPNKYAQFDFWPDGFCKYMDEINNSIIMKIFEVNE